MILTPTASFHQVPDPPSTKKKYFRNVLVKYLFNTYFNHFSTNFPTNFPTVVFNHFQLRNGPNKVNHFYFPTVLQN